MRVKSDRGWNSLTENVRYVDIRAIDVDLLVDFQVLVSCSLPTYVQFMYYTSTTLYSRMFARAQMWYPCQNQSSTANYELCQASYPREVITMTRAPHARR